MSRTSNRFASVALILLTLGAPLAHARGDNGGSAGGGSGGGGAGSGEGGSIVRVGLLGPASFVAAPPRPSRPKPRPSRSAPLAASQCGGIESVHFTEFQRCPR